jgi:hypothetical protein
MKTNKELYVFRIGLQKGDKSSNKMIKNETDLDIEIMFSTLVRNVLLIVNKKRTIVFMVN